MRASIASFPASSRSWPFLAWQLGVIGVVLAAVWSGPGWGSMWGAGIALLVGWLEPRRWHVALGLRKRGDWRRVVLFGLVAGVVQLLLVKVVLTPVIEHLTGQRRDLSMFDDLRGNWHALFAMLPIVWISAGLCEEVVFRGIVLGRLRMALGGSRIATAAAVVASCLVFGLAHGYQGLAGWILTGILGGVLALIYVLSDYCLWYGIALHLVYDTLATACITLGYDRTLAAWGAHLFG